VLRLVPGLFAMLVVTVLTLGAEFSILSFPRYISDPQTIKYFLGCLSIVSVKYELPGVFSTNPLQAVNGSLWTLRYELLCYVGVAAAGWIGLFKFTNSRKVILILGVLLTSVVLIWLDTKGYEQSNDKLGMLYELARLAMCFLLGSLYSEYEDRIPIKFAVLLGILALMIFLIRTPLFAPVAIVATAYATFWLAFVPRGRWIRWTRTAPDYSYGIYIYAFPIQQVLISLMPDISPAANISLGFSFTLVFAAASWHLIEKPALSLKRLRTTFRSSSDHLNRYVGDRQASKIR
jgi:peptidoglycan/LPS O-acetylase OafA/YrhL